MKYENKTKKELIALLEERDKRISDLVSISQTYDEIFRNAKEGVAVSRKGMMIFFNKAMEEITGYSVDEIIGREASIFVHPDDRDFIAANRSKQISGKDAGGSRDIRIVKKDGDIRWIRITSRKITWQGEKATFTVTTDITDNKLAEQALLESEKRYRLLIEMIGESVFTINADGIITDYIQEGEDFDSFFRHGLEGVHYLAIVYPDDMEIVKRACEECFQGANKSLEIRFINESGDNSWRWLVLRPGKNDRGRVDSIYGLAINITERKDAEEKIRLSEEKFQKIFKQSPDVITISTADTGAYLDFNDRFEEITGWSPGEVLGKTASDINVWVNPEDRNVVVQALKAHGTLKDFITSFRLKDGTIKPALYSSSSIMIDNKPHIISTIRDISDLVRAREIIQQQNEDLAAANEELSATNEELESINEELSTAQHDIMVSEVKYRTVFNGAQESILIIQEGYIVFANPAFKKIMKVPDDLSRFLFTDIIHADDLEMVVSYNVKRMKGEKVPDSYDLRLVDFEGNGLWAHVSVSVIEWDGRPASLVFGLDVTEKKKSEKLVLESLHEKETLLKEIHHRVKNNMQVISSMLSLQSSYVKSEEDLELFNESQNRIQAMALIHENLYRSSSFSQISFNSYILELATRLFESYNVSESRVTLDISVDDSTITIEKAIPCAQIINELMSNALKYAFPEGRSGVISIRFRREDDNRYYLQISDNGAGFPDDTDFYSTGSLGLKIINALVSQLKGEITLKTGKNQGVTFVLTF